MNTTFSLNLNELTFFTKPTNVWIFDNVLEDSLFQELRAQINFERQIVDGHGKRKLNMNNGLDGFLKQSPLWQEFVSHIEYGPNLIERNCFRDLQSDSRSRHIGRELSDLNYGSEVVPHKDKYSKIASFIFYFNEYGEANVDGVGSTQFYTPRKKRHNSNLFNQPLPFEEVDTVLQADSIPNRLVVFQRSATSWHGVQPIQVKDFSRPVYIMALMRKQSLKDSMMEFCNKFL